MVFVWLRKRGSLALLVSLLLLQLACLSEAVLLKRGERLYWEIEAADIPWKVFARSVEGRNINLLEMGNGEKTTLIMGGFHGSEPLSTKLALRFAEFLYFEYQEQLDCKVVIIPCVNPDGLVHGFRVNAHGVDINRNFPSGDWSPAYRRSSNYPGKEPASEPETRAVMQLIEIYQPDRIISIHTPLKMVSFDGPGRELAIKMALLNGYPVAESVGYPTPGSLGSYTGVEKQIPTITLELPRTSFDKIWQENKEALLLTIIYRD